MPVPRRASAMAGTRASPPRRRSAAAQRLRRAAAVRAGARHLASAPTNHATPWWIFTASRCAPAARCGARTKHRSRSKTMSWRQRRAVAESLLRVSTKPAAPALPRRRRACAHRKHACARVRAVARRPVTWSGRMPASSSASRRWTSSGSRCARRTRCAVKSRHNLEPNRPVRRRTLLFAQENACGGAGHTTH